MLVSFPVYFHLGSLRIHPHFIFETLAYAVAFRFYLYQRRWRGDALDDANELLCCLPQVAAPPGLSYKNIFSVLIV
jgi:hypothetical protein